MLKWFAPTCWISRIPETCRACCTLFTERFQGCRHPSCRPKKVQHHKYEWTYIVHKQHYTITTITNMPVLLCSADNVLWLLCGWSGSSQYFVCNPAFCRLSRLLPRHLWCRNTSLTSIITRNIVTHSTVEPPRASTCLCLKVGQLVASKATSTTGL